MEFKLLRQVRIYMSCHLEAAIDDGSDALRLQLFLIIHTVTRAVMDAKPIYLLSKFDG